MALLVFLSFMATSDGNFACYHDTPRHCAEVIQARLQTNFRGLNLQFVLSEPGSGRYSTIFFTNEPATAWGFGPTIVGATPGKSMSVVFSCFSNMSQCADVATHELGHQLGLMHSADPRDFMHESVGGSTWSVTEYGILRERIEELRRPS